MEISTKSFLLQNWRPLTLKWSTIATASSYWAFSGQALGKAASEWCPWCDQRGYHHHLRLSVFDLSPCCFHEINDNNQQKVSWLFFFLICFCSCCFTCVFPITKSKLFDFFYFFNYSFLFLFDSFWNSSIDFAAQNQNANAWEGIRCQPSTGRDLLVAAPWQSGWPNHQLGRLTGVFSVGILELLLEFVESWVNPGWLLWPSWPWELWSLGPKFSCCFSRSFIKFLELLSLGKTSVVVALEGFPCIHLFSTGMIQQACYQCWLPMFCSHLRMSYHLRPKARRSWKVARAKWKTTSSREKEKSFQGQLNNHYIQTCVGHSHYLIYGYGLVECI